MRPLLQAQGVSKSFGSHHVLREAEFIIHPGDKIALVGPNGAGKSTLFKIIAGKLQADLGDFEAKPDLRIEYLAQIPDIDPSTPVASLLAAPTEVAKQLQAQLTELENWMAQPDAWEQPDANEKMQRYSELQEKFAEESAKGDALRNPLLNDLGVDPSALDAKFGDLSGGERSKVLLAKALNAAKDMDILMLDEPTNHMDIPTVQFIEEYLVDLKAAVVLSAHDQYLLDNVANRVFEVDQKRVFAYTGNYSSYLGQRDAIARAVEAKKRKDYNEVKRQLQIIEQLKGRNRFDSQVQSRKTRLAKQDRYDETAPSKKRGFKLFLDVDRVPKEVLEVNGLSKSYGERNLFSHVSFEVEGDDKLGIIGANGTGKSTLLKLLLGLETPDSGEAKFGKNCHVGYFDQHHSTLESDRTLLEEVQTLRDPPPPDEWSRGLLGRFKFSGDDVFKRVKDLSGGERARLSLAKFIAERHNVLVLDEPTNHLDLESQDIIADALANYEGCLIVVSHDRAFLDKVCNRIAVIAHKRVGVFKGNFSDTWTSSQMKEFVGKGIQGRYKVLKAFRDWEKDEKFHQGQIIEVTGMETQQVRRMYRSAEANGWLEPIQS